MSGSWAGRRVAIGLDDRVVLRKPQPSHLIAYGPRERPLMSLIPHLNVLRENVGSEIGVEGLVIINLPRISEIHMVSHVLADRGEIDASGDAQIRKLGWVADSGEH